MDKHNLIYHQLEVAEKDVIRIAEIIVDLSTEPGREFSYQLQRLGSEIEHITAAVKRLRELRVIRSEEELEDD